MTEPTPRLAAICVAGLLALSAAPVLAADVSQDAVDACIDAVRSESAAAPGGLVLSTEFSEANSLVVLQDGAGSVWRCLVSNDGSNAFVEASDAAPVHAAPQPDYADGMQCGRPGFLAHQRAQQLNVHSAPSTSSPTVARLHRGMVI